MSKEKLESGVETTFHDKDGKSIRVHSYIKDGDGMVYYINSHCQAVPEDEAPAVELANLLDSRGGSECPEAGAQAPRPQTA